MKAIQIFLNHHLVGNNQTRAARLLGVPQQYVYNWAKGKKVKADMPIELVIRASAIMDEPPKNLRPDIFKRIRPNVSRRISKIKRARAGGME